MYKLSSVRFDQVQASMKYTCIGEQCQATELYDLLQEMDRRYFLLQDLRWEFSMLDREHTDAISVEQARFAQNQIQLTVEFKCDSTSR